MIYLTHYEIAINIVRSKGSIPEYRLVEELLFESRTIGSLEEATEEARKALEQGESLGVFARYCDEENRVDWVEWTEKE